jgi:hypothetical protein
MILSMMNQLLGKKFVLDLPAQRMTSQVRRVLHHLILFMALLKVSNQAMALLKVINPDQAFKVLWMQTSLELLQKR